MSLPCAIVKMSLPVFCVRVLLCHYHFFVCVGVLLHKSHLLLIANIWKWCTWDHSCLWYKQQGQLWQSTGMACWGWCIQDIPWYCKTSGWQQEGPGTCGNIPFVHSHTHIHIYSHILTYTRLHLFTYPHSYLHPFTFTYIHPHPFTHLHQLCTHQNNKRQVSRAMGEEFARTHGMLFIECSAKTSDEIDHTFDEVARKILETPSLLENSKPIKLGQDLSHHGTAAPLDLNQQEDHNAAGDAGGWCCN